MEFHKEGSKIYLPQRKYGDISSNVSHKSPKQRSVKFKREKPQLFDSASKFEMFQKTTPRKRS